MPDPRCRLNYNLIPAGEFRMGTSRKEQYAFEAKTGYEGCFDERPLRKIYVSDFCMGEHEVTNAEFDAYAERECINIRSKEKGFDGPNQPRVYVDWNSASRYCESLGCRLPTEAEWEKAARGGSGKLYATYDGNLSVERANYHSDRTVDVCSYPKNDYGLCDMTGNAAEWVADLYRQDAYDHLTYKDPKGPVSTMFGFNDRIVRGGSYHDYDPYFLRSTKRNGTESYYGFTASGFRCACDVETGVSLLMNILMFAIKDASNDVLASIASGIETFLAGNIWPTK